MSDLEDFDADEQEAFPFLRTSVTTRIFKSIELARTFRWNASIIGAPGVGKTHSLLAYVREHRDAVYVEVTPGLGNSWAALIEAIHDKVSAHYAIDAKGMERNLRSARPARWLIVLDEAQNLPLKHARSLLHLSVEDKPHLVFVFCGNDQMLKKTKQTESAFAQIERRIPFNETIKSIADEDADTIALAEGVEGMEAYRLLRKVGQRAHADGVFRAISVAKEFADGGTVNVAHLRQALGMLPQYAFALKSK